MIWFSARVVVRILLTRKHLSATASSINSLLSFFKFIPLATVNQFGSIFFVTLSLSPLYLCSAWYSEAMRTWSDILLQNSSGRIRTQQSLVHALVGKSCSCVKKLAKSVLRRGTSGVSRCLIRTIIEWQGWNSMRRTVQNVHHARERRLGHGRCGAHTFIRMQCLRSIHIHRLCGPVV